MRKPECQMIFLLSLIIEEPCFAISNHQVNSRDVGRSLAITQSIEQVPQNKVVKVHIHPSSSVKDLVNISIQNEQGKYIPIDYNVFGKIEKDGQRADEARGKFTGLFTRKNGQVIFKIVDSE